MEFINQWLAEMGIAPFVGAVVIAVATIIAAKMVQLLGHRVAARSSRWSKSVIRLQLLQIVRSRLWITVLLLGILIQVKWLNPAAHIDFLITAPTKTALAIMWVLF